MIFSFYLFYFTLLRLSCPRWLRQTTFTLPSARTKHGEKRGRTCRKCHLSSLRNMNDFEMFYFLLFGVHALLIVLVPSRDKRFRISCLSTRSWIIRGIAIPKTRLASTVSDWLVCAAFSNFGSFFVEWCMGRIPARGNGAKRMAFRRSRASDRKRILVRFGSWLRRLRCVHMLRLAVPSRLSTCVLCRHVRQRSGRGMDVEWRPSTRRLSTRILPSETGLRALWRDKTYNLGGGWGV
ncbi:hypothetical protein VTK73DRAFT_1289 [Phialemonium thermophilum]|uniref:Secreted protein n=1 Tax=Phialemonium thermophilum TaxID=223376 RepID=A0ABR3VTR7_9PEZI